MNTSQVRSLLILGALAVVAAGVTLTALFVLLRPSGVQASTTVLTILSGDVYVGDTRSNDFKLAEDGQGLQLGDTVRTAGNARAIVTYLDGTTTEMEPQTEITIKRDTVTKTGRSIRISQVLGTTWHHVMTAVGGSSDYEVESPDAVAAVRDTLFQVTVVQDGTTTVRVTEGAVATSGAGVEVLVLAGQETTVKPGQAPAHPTSSALAPSEIRIRLGSPAWITLTDPVERSVGVVPPGVAINQQPGSLSDDALTEPQNLVVHNPQTGDYIISIEAKGDGGPYTLTAGALTDTRIVFLRRLEGAVKAGERWEAQLSLVVENGRIVSASLSDPSLATNPRAAHYVLTDFASKRAADALASVVASQPTLQNAPTALKGTATIVPASTGTPRVVAGTPTPSGGQPAGQPTATRPAAVAPTATPRSAPPPTSTPVTAPTPACRVQPPAPSAGTVEIGSATAARGCTVIVAIALNTGGQGVNTWTINVNFDPGQLDYISCSQTHGPCNVVNAGASVIFPGNNATDLTGTIQVGTITFRVPNDAPPGSCVTLGGDISVYAGGVPPHELNHPVVSPGLACIR